MSIPGFDWTLKAFHRQRFRLHQRNLTYVRKIVKDCKNESICSGIFNALFFHMICTKS